MGHYFDAHIHLDQYSIDDLDRLIDQWQASGVKGVLSVSSNLSSAYQTLELQQKYEGFVYAALGIHPEQDLPLNADIAELSSLIKHEQDRIYAIGEVGLPYYLYQESNVSHVPK